MYVFDTNVFIALGTYYPRRFPTIWKRIDSLADSDKLISVREARRELENYCPFDHILEWANRYRHIFYIPTNEECEIVSEIFKKPQYREFVKKNNILRGLPVADPFIIASAKFNDRLVVTQESKKPKGARIPTACKDFGVKCIDLEGFLEKEDLEY